MVDSTLSNKKEMELLKMFLTASLLISMFQRVMKGAPVAEQDTAPSDSRKHFRRYFV